MNEFSQYPITILLIASNVIFSLLALNSRSVLNQTIMWPYGVNRDKQYYRFITSGFIHADLIHLFFNMFTLFFFGRNMEIIFSALQLGGPLAYLGLYFSALIVSDIPSYLKNIDNPGYHSLGASGAVSAVVFASVIFSPWSSVYLYGAIKLSALLFAVLYVVYCVYMSKKSVDNINHDAHLWGSLFGVAFTLILILSIQPELFGPLMEELKHPSIFGR